MGTAVKRAMVCAHCDNTAVVEIIHSGRAKNPLLAHQLQGLFYTCVLISRSRRCILWARRTAQRAYTSAQARYAEFCATTLAVD